MNTTVSEGNTKVQLELNALVQLVTQLKTEELQKFARQINQIVAERLQKQPSQEDELLKKVDLALNPKEAMRMEELYELFRNEIISEEQLIEYRALTKKSERLNVERMKALVELSKIRGVHVDELMKSLNIAHT